MTRTDLDLKKTSVTIGNSSIHIEETSKGDWKLRISAISGGTQVTLLVVEGALDEKMVTMITATPFTPDPGRGKFAMRPNGNLVAKVPHPPVPFMDM